MLKIVFVTSSVGIGGNEKVLLNIINSLEGYPFDISLLSLDGNYSNNNIPNYVNKLNAGENFEILALGFKKGIIKAFLKKKFTLIGGFFKEKIKDYESKKKNYYINFWESHKNKINNLDNQYDIAIAFGLGIQVLFTSEKINAKRKIAWINNDCSKCLESNEISYLKKIYSNYDKIVTVTEAAQLGYRAAFSDVLTPTIIIKDLFNENDIIEKSLIEPNPFNESDRPIIVTVGRISREKGYNLLLNAARRMKDSGVKFKWYIIGNGDFSKYLDDAKKISIDNSVIFCGAKKNPYPYIKNCDIYVQTSLWEGNCLTLIEAMVLKKPIVTTNFPSAKEKITSGVNGLICEMNENSLSSAIIRLINDKRLRKNFVKELEINKINNKNELKEIINLFLEDE